MIVELTELSFNNIGTWPKRVKIACIMLMCGTTLLGAYWIDIHSKLIHLNDAKRTEMQLQSDYFSIQQHTATFPALSSQLNMIQKSFDRLILQLPVHSDMPGFLEALSRTGIAAGLKFILFKPLSEEQKDIYAELPIEISVVGSYHQMAAFISAIASFNRMITFRDFTIYPIKNSSSSSGRAVVSNREVDPEHLVLNMILVTYRDITERSMLTSQSILPIFKSSNSFVYTANGLRSPFQKNITQTAVNDSDGELNQHRESLEYYPLDSLRLVGTVSLSGLNWALVTASDGMVYRVKKGDAVGQNHGHITSITSNTMIVLEKINEEGVPKLRETELVLVSH